MLSQIGHMLIPVASYQKELTTQSAGCYKLLSGNIARGLVDGGGGEFSANHLLKEGWSTLSKRPKVSNVAPSHRKHSPELKI